MNIVECPICKEMHDENEACPRCSFEFHQKLFPLSKHFQTIEEARVSSHTKWWDKLQKNIVERSVFDQKIQELDTAHSRISELNQIAASKDEELKAKQEDINNLNAKCSELAESNQSLAEENSSLSQKNNDLKDQIGEKENTIKVLNEEIERLKILIQKEPVIPVSTPPFYVPVTKAYLIQKEYGEITNIYPIYQGKTIVGSNPQTKEENLNICTLVADSKEIQDSHFSIEIMDDGSIVANRIGDNWGIDYEGNNIKTFSLQNGTQIYIGKQLQLIIIVS